MDSALISRVGNTILNEMTCVKTNFLDLQVQCSDGTIFCQKLIISILGPLIGRSLAGVEDPLLILPDNTCKDLIALLNMVWDQETTHDFSEYYFCKYHWVDFKLKRSWTISSLTTTSDSVPGFYMAEEREIIFYETHQNFEEKFSQFAKQLDSEKRKSEANKTFEVITKHLQNNLDVELVESSPLKMLQGQKVQTIPMECDTYDNCEPNDSSPNKILPTKETSQCAQCGKILRDKFSLKKHEQIVHMKIKNFCCDKCEKKFGHKVDLLDHVRTIHEKVKEFICDLCGLALSSRQTLKTHRLIHEASTKNISCDKCSNSFRHRNTYNKHIRRVHEFDPSKSLNCDVCNKTFKHDEGLKRHVKKTHDTISKKFPCELCHKTFAFMYDLTKHSKSHNSHKNRKVAKKSVPMTLGQNQSQPETFYLMNDMEGNPIEFDIAVVAPSLNSILGQ
eukprot:GFUD01008376.1.p1 GENE.GFUD01008376.1~~GFUD01008376.1.p1  ORF type:complete len:462 (-),score=73.28 GFUD01008376.1:42-1385(-)